MPDLTFRLGPELGRGSFGVVVSAVDVCGSGMTVAVKKSRVSLRVMRTRLRHEARVMQILQGHPAIPKFIGYARAPHFEYIAMDLLGTDLKKTFEAGHALKPGTVARIAEQMLSALEHLNLHGIVHRDIKPENILLCPSDSSRVALVDFGLARQYTLPTHRTHQTIVGTVYWCSINSHLGFDLRPYDDLESLAYSLLYLLMGGLPWIIKVPNEPSKNSEIRTLATKQAFPDSTIFASIPVEFRDLFDFTRNAKGDIEASLKKMQADMRNLAFDLGKLEQGPLDLTPVAAASTLGKVDFNFNPAPDSDDTDGSSDDSVEEYSNSYFAMDIDQWDMRAGRDKTLTFPAGEGELLDRQIPEIGILDDYVSQNALKKVSRQR